MGLNSETQGKGVRCGADRRKKHGAGDSKVTETGPLTHEAEKPASMQQPSWARNTLHACLLGQ